jgi:hypothetical protein
VDQVGDRPLHTDHVARNESLLEACPDAVAPHILLKRAGEPDTVRIYLNEVRYLADAMCSMAGRVAGRVVGDGTDSTNGT